MKRILLGLALVFCFAAPLASQAETTVVVVRHHHHHHHHHHNPYRRQ